MTRDKSMPINRGEIPVGTKVRLRTWKEIIEGEECCKCYDDLYDEVVLKFPGSSIRYLKEMDEMAGQIAVVAGVWCDKGYALEDPEGEDLYGQYEFTEEMFDIVE